MNIKVAAFTESEKSSNNFVIFQGIQTSIAKKPWPIFYFYFSVGGVVQTTSSTPYTHVRNV